MEEYFEKESQEQTYICKTKNENTQLNNKFDKSLNKLLINNGLLYRYYNIVAAKPQLLYN